MDGSFHVVVFVVGVLESDCLVWSASNPPSEIDTTVGFFGNETRGLRYLHFGYQDLFK